MTFPSTPIANQWFPLLTEKICLLCEAIFVEEVYYEFCTFTERGTESALFLFSSAHSTFCCSAKIKQGYFAKHQSFFYCKTRVLHTVTVYCFTIIFRFSISVITAEKVRIIWTLPINNSRSPEGVGFRACYSAPAESLTAPFRKLNVLGELQESALFEMTDKSLRVKLVIVSLIEHNLNQQISLVNFRSFNSTRKANIDESFDSSAFKPDTALPNVS